MEILTRYRDIRVRGTGIELLSADDFATWFLTVEVLGETVYAVRTAPLLSRYPLYRLVRRWVAQGEKFALKFRFEPQYPIASPAVQFVVDDKWKAPVHPVCPLARIPLAP